MLTDLICFQSPEAKFQKKFKQALLFHNAVAISANVQKNLPPDCLHLSKINKNNNVNYFHLE